MADTKAKLDFRENEDGSVSVGVSYGKAFVPVASADAGIVRHFTQDVTDTNDDDTKGGDE